MPTTKCMLYFCLILFGVQLIVYQLVWLPTEPKRSLNYFKQSISAERELSWPRHHTACAWRIIPQAASPVELLLAFLGITKWGGQQWKNREKCLDGTKINRQLPWFSFGISKDRALKTHAVLCVERSKHDMMLVRSSRKNILKALQGLLLLHRAESATKSLSSHAAFPCDVEATSSRKKGKTNNSNNQSRKQNERGASSTVACRSHLNI